LKKLAEKSPTQANRADPKKDRLRKQTSKTGKNLSAGFADFRR
jgi:hypothetical protein